MNSFFEFKFRIFWLKYQGMITWKFKDWLKEQITDIKYDISKPTIALSRLNQKHAIDIDFSKTRIIVCTSKTYSLIINLRNFNPKKEYLNDILSYSISKIWYGILNISNILKHNYHILPYPSHPFLWNRLL